jgi:hypothetical protein
MNLIHYSANVPRMQPVQIDGPEAPAPEELEGLHEQQEPAYTHNHSNNSALVMGANNNSFCSAATSMML